MPAPASYYDLPYDEIYDSWKVTFALTSGQRISEDEREHPLELAVFKGKLVAFQPNGGEEQPLETPIKAEITVYSGWDNDVGEFDGPLDEELGIAALAIGKFQTGTYSVMVAVRDEGSLLSDRWLSLLEVGSSNAKSPAFISLGSRCDLPADEDTSAFVEDYAWAALGVQPAEFGDELDRGEHEPPIAHFEVAL